MTFNDLWIMSIEKELKKENFKEAIRLAKVGLGWSKDDLIKSIEELADELGEKKTVEITADEAEIIEDEVSEN